MPTMQGSSVMLKTHGTISKTMFVNDAKVIKSDILTSNGVIHIIDRVLEPAPATPAPTAATQVKGEAAAPTPETTAPAPQTTTRNESTTTTTTTTTNPPNPTS